MGLFDGTSLERPVTCARCEKPLAECRCPKTADGTVLLPGDQKARVRREKRAKGKVVTAVAGLDPVAADAAAIVAHLRKRCGTGGTVQPDGTIELQGEHVEAVASVLRERGFKVSVG